MEVAQKVRRNLDLLRRRFRAKEPHSYCGEKVRPLFEEAALAHYSDDPGLAGRSLGHAQLALYQCLDISNFERTADEIERWFSFFGMWGSARLLEKGGSKMVIVILEDLEESFGPHAEELGILQDYGRENTAQIHSLIVRALDSIRKGDFTTAIKLADDAANIQYRLAIEKAGVPAPPPSTWGKKGLKWK